MKFLLCYFSVIFFSASAAWAQTDATLLLEKIDAFAEVLQQVQEYYVDEVDQAAAFDNAMRGLVAGLDAHSAYLNAEEYEDLRISTAGRYTGIGLEISINDNRVTVVSPIEGSPAELAGLKAGDVVLFVNDIAVNQEDIKSAVNLMRGDVGTPVKITVARSKKGAQDTEQALLHFEVVRQHIEVASVRSAWWQPGIAYLRITQFNQTSAAEAASHIKALKKEQLIKGLVLDLRNNPGGILESARDISDLFLDTGTIVTASGRVDDANFGMSAKPGDVLKGAPMVVWINGGSASASEIVAGALQDHRRAKIVGEKSFGKGSVQTIIPLASGEALKITTSKYFTPSGDSIHGVGIQPDQYIDSNLSDDEAQANVLSILTTSISNAT